MKIKDQPKKLKCHYCYSCDDGRRYIPCSEQSKCSNAFCLNCLQKFFDMGEANLPKKWKCLVCQKICNCESCREEAESEKDVLKVEDWRGKACLEDEDKYCGPKIYRTNEPKLNCAPGQPLNRHSANNIIRRETLSRGKGGDGGRLKKRRRREDSQEDMQDGNEAEGSGRAQGLEQRLAAPRQTLTCPQFACYSAVLLNPSHSAHLLLVNPFVAPLVYPPRPPFSFPSEANYGQRMGGQIREEAAKERGASRKVRDKVRHKADRAKIIKREDMKS